MEEFEILKFKDNDFEMNVNFSIEDEMIWLNLKEICVLFNKVKSTISRHINRVITEITTSSDSVVAKNATVGASVVAKRATVAPNGKVYQIDYYNLEVIVMVGVRVKSNRGTLLKQFLYNYLNERRKNKDKTNEIIMYNNGSVNLSINISPSEETVWLSQEQIAILYETSKQNISKHIKAIVEDGELSDSVVNQQFTTDDSVHKESLYMSPDGKQYWVRFYNLDMILAVGYRVKSKRAMEFRRWVSKVLKEYMLKGYVINDTRTTITDENYINLVYRVNMIEKEVEYLKVRDKHLFIEDMFFFENEAFTAKMIAEKLIATAQESLLLMDPYADITALDLLSHKKEAVSLTIIVPYKTKLKQSEIDAFVSEYGDVEILYDDSGHDRYLIIDDIFFYHFGASFNYLGKKFSQVSQVKDEELIELLKQRIKRIRLKNIQ